MAFLDEDQPYAPRRAPAPRRRGPERQQIAARRGIAIVVAIIVLILLVVGIKGCLDARKQRSLENYASDVNSLVTSSDQLSNDLFKQLGNPSSLGPGLDLQQSIASDRGIADGLLTRARDISAPGEVSGAKGSLVLAFQLRSNGIAGLAAALQSGASATQAAQLAADHMKELVASDVIYIQSKNLADAALASANVSATIKPSAFMQDPTRWLDPNQLLPLIGSGGSGATGGTPCAPKGTTCGLGIGSTAIGGTTLTPGVAATVTGSTIDVTVQNQGQIAESNVQVSYQLTGGASGSGAIPSIPAQGSKTINLKIKPAPKAGDSGTLKVSVAPVDGEQITQNNKSTYSVTFG